MTNEEFLSRQNNAGDAQPPALTEGDKLRWLTKYSNADIKTAVEAVLAERAAAAEQLGNLLARIHGDGGHYEDKHGTAKAVEDADVIVCELQGARRDAAERIMALEAARDSYARMAHQLGQEFINRLAANFIREPPDVR